MRLPFAHGALLACLLGGPAPSNPPRLTLDDLAFLAGEWTGTLEYLDYADNRTRQTLGASLACTRGASAIEYRFSYIEPNGVRVNGDAVRLTLADGGTRVRLNDEQWRVIGREVDEARGRYAVVISRAGSDADKPAAFRRTMELAGDTLVIRTEVRPQGEAAWFVRNRHVLEPGG